MTINNLATLFQSQPNAARLICNFLDNKDIASLDQTCKTIHNKLDHEQINKIICNNLGCNQHLPNCDTWAKTKLELKHKLTLCLKGEFEIKWKAVSESIVPPFNKNTIRHASILHKKLNLPTVNRQPLGINKVIWNNIFTHLDDKSLVMLSRTEKTLYSLLEDHWKAKVTKLSKERGFETPVDVTSWSRTYALFSGKALQAAAKKGAINCLQTLQGHTDMVHSVAVQGDTIISGSIDHTIKVWDIKTGLCLQTLQGHTDMVHSVAVQGDTIISGSIDHTIKIWDIKTGLCLQTLQGHTDGVDSVAIQGDTIISGSWDNTIKVWDIKTGDCLKTLQGHTDSVRSVAVQGDTIISGGSWDNTIKVWDIKTGDCLQTLQGHASSVKSVAVQGDTIISGSSDNTIKVWDLKTGDCLKTLQGHIDGVDSLAIQGDTIISGSSDKTIKIWDVKTGACLQTLQGHTSWIHSVAIQGDTIISGSNDKTIKVWSY